jgi:sec-independent protein translocase protein TatA
MLLFFDIGTPELFLIILVIIIFFGSKKIPELARGIGKGVKEFKNATSEIQREIHSSAKNIQKDIKDNLNVEDEKTNQNQ